MTILVVDDEAEIAGILRENIESLGHACITCGDVASARGVVASVQVDAMALDLGLPGGDPLAWLETLAGERPRLAERTVVITGSAPETEAILRLEACGASLLRKPFKLAELSRRLLGEREAARDKQGP